MNDTPQNNEAVRSPETVEIVEEGIVVHPETTQPKADVLEVQNVTNEAIPDDQRVPLMSPEFEPTSDMLKFRDVLVRTDAMRQGIHQVCRDAGLHEDTYFKWMSRYGEPFKQWISKQWAMRKQAGLLKLLSIGLSKAETDFNYWAKMIDLFGKDDAIAPAPNWQEVQRITAQYTLEKKKGEGSQ